MRKKQTQFNPSGIKWLTKVDMPLNKTQTRRHVGMKRPKQNSKQVWQLKETNEKILAKEERLKKYGHRVK